jgi:hypothetical protein
MNNPIQSKTSVHNVDLTETSFVRTIQNLANRQIAVAPFSQSYIYPGNGNIAHSVENSFVHFSLGDQGFEDDNQISPTGV